MSPGLKAMLTPEIKAKRIAARIAATPSLAERFHAKYHIDNETGCWIWTGATDRRGYGKIGHNYKTRISTHVSLELHGHPRPAGLCALHSCDNPRCVNPDHLRWGTLSDNMKDAFERGRITREHFLRMSQKGAEAKRMRAEWVKALAGREGEA